MDQLALHLFIEQWDTRNQHEKLQINIKVYINMIIHTNQVQPCILTHYQSTLQNSFTVENRVMIAHGLINTLMKKTTPNLQTLSQRDRHQMNYICFFHIYV